MLVSEWVLHSGLDSHIIYMADIFVCLWYTSYNDAYHFHQNIHLCEVAGEMVISLPGPVNRKRFPPPVDISPTCTFPLLFECLGRPP